MFHQDIKVTKRYGQTVGRSDGQRENIVCGGINSIALPTYSANQIQSVFKVQVLLEK